MVDLNNAPVENRAYLLREDLTDYLVEYLVPVVGEYYSSFERLMDYKTFKQKGIQFIRHYISRKLEALIRYYGEDAVHEFQENLDEYISEDDWKDYYDLVKNEVERDIDDMNDEYDEYNS